jgi:circadian clock protein KaiC
MVRDFRPRVVIVDPITNFVAVGSSDQIRMMLMRLVDFLKAQQVTGLFTSLIHGGGAAEATDTAISSLIDTWLLLRDTELNGERNRVLYVLKARGTAHSNQVREFLITSRGIELIDVYIGADRVLTGSARMAQEAKERAATLVREQEVERKRREFERRRQALEAQIAALRADLEAGEDELRQAIAEANGREDQLTLDRSEMGWMRRADRDGAGGVVT